MTAPLIDSTMLFRFEIAIRRRELSWTAKGLELPDSCRVPCFSSLSGGPIFADLRMAWSETGLGFDLRVSGKRQLPWCRDTRLDESDGLQLWIDTRNSPNIHRATQHCHRFLFMPAGGGPQREKPLASLLPINRARANPKPIAGNTLHHLALPRHDGYAMSGIIPTTAMTGYDPTDQSKLGFYYAIIDRELGSQTLTLGMDFPVAEDPSLWGVASLIDAASR